MRPLRTDELPGLSKCGSDWGGAKRLLIARPFGDPSLNLYGITPGGVETLPGPLTAASPVLRGKQARDDTNFRELHSWEQVYW